MRQIQLRQVAAWLLAAAPFVVGMPARAEADGESICTVGRSQSPIAIDTRSALPSQLQTPVPNYHPSGVVAWSKKGEKYDTLYELFAVSEGAPGPGDNTLQVDGVTFRLIELHFHRPGEHPIDGRAPAMELHLVHSDASGNLAVLAVPIEVAEWAADDPAIAQLWRSLPQAGDERRLLPELFDPSGLLPTSRVAYRYPGSLTTGTCSENVRWTVFAERLVISKGQEAEYLKYFSRANSRTPQAANGRVPLRSTP